MDCIAIAKAVNDLSALGSTNSATTREHSYIGVNLMTVDLGMPTQLRVLICVTRLMPFLEDYLYQISQITLTMSILLRLPLSLNLFWL
jgi:hypothetical protein